MPKLPSLAFTLFTLTALVLPGLIPLPVQAAPNPPGAPTGLVVSSGPGPGEISLKWTAPANNGGSPITGYQVYRSQTPGQPAKDEKIGNLLTYTDRCVGHSQTWYYQVAAINAAGEGTRSSEAAGVSGIPPLTGDSVVLLGGRLPTRRSGTAAVWTGTTAYVFGGNVAQGDNVVRYDPVLDCATDTDGLLPGTYIRPSALWDGRYAYLYGGRNFQLGLASKDIVRFDPALNTGTLLLQSLPSAREGTSAVLADGKQLVFGGTVDGPFGSDETQDVVDAATGHLDGSLPEARTNTAAVWTGDQAFILGGSRDQLEWAQIYAYDPVSQLAFEQLTSLPHGGIQGASAIWDGSRVHIVGGRRFGGALLNEIQRYDPLLDGTISFVPTLPQRLPYAVSSASSAWDGRNMYLFGGQGTNQNLDTILRYTPSVPGDRDPPQAVQALRGPQPGEITLNWQAPSDASGVTAYRIYRGLTPATVIRHAETSNVLTFVDAGLAEGSFWCYKVTAMYGTVEGRISNDVCTKAPERPIAPQLLTAKPGASLGEVNLSWQPPLDDGGLPVTNYNVYRNGALVGNATTTSFVDTGVSPWILHSFAVSAVNAVAEGPKSSTVTSFAASTPSLPRNLQTLVTGPGLMTVTWLPPATDGGKTILHYNLYRTEPDGTERWIEELPPVLTYRDSYLDSDKYLYRVTAVNAFGEGQSTSAQEAWAKTVTDRPWLSCTPGAGVNPGAVHLEWELEDDGGSPVQFYAVFRGTDPLERGPQIATVDAPVQQYDDTPGVPGVNYYYEVDAHNLVGVSASNTERCFVAPPPPPGGGGPSDFCGILDIADLDGDGDPDCSDPDIDGDHLSNELEDKDHLRMDPRDPDYDNDNHADHKDPDPFHAGFGIAVELYRLCVHPAYDGFISEEYIGWADPFLTTAATLKINESDPADSLRIDIPKLRRDDHLHGKECHEPADLAKDYPVTKTRDVIDLPTSFLAAWQWTGGPIDVPELNVEFPLSDHDTWDCFDDSYGLDHLCGENFGGDAAIGTPKPEHLWSLMTLKWPGDAGVEVGKLDTAKLGVNFTLKKGDPPEVEVKLRAGINASGCDLVNAILGRPLPPAGQELETVVGVSDFRILDQDAGDVCSRL